MNTTPPATNPTPPPSKTPAAATEPTARACHNCRHGQTHDANGSAHCAPCADTPAGPSQWEPIEPAEAAAPATADTAVADANTAARGNRPWQSYEIGYLLALAVDGRAYATIAAALDRTPPACARMLARLVSEDHPTPQEFAATLARAKQIFSAPAAPAAGPRQTRTEAMDRVAAQYRALAASNAQLAEAIRGVEALLVFGLAEAVANGATALDEVARFLGPFSARRIHRKAAEIRLVRTAAAPRTKPAAETAPPLPLIYAGHARDLTPPGPPDPPRSATRQDVG